MGEKIKIETAAQGGAVHLPDSTLHRVAGVGDENVHPAVGAHRVVERVRHRLVIGQIHRTPGDARLARFLQGRRRSVEGLAVQVHQINVGALLGEQLRGGAADARRRAGDVGHLPLKNWRLGFPQFRLLQRPVFHVEQVGVAQRLVSADVERALDDFEGVLVEIGRYFRFLHGFAHRHQTQTRDQYHPGQAVQLLQVDPLFRLVGDEVFVIRLVVAFQRCRKLGAQTLGIVEMFWTQQQGFLFGADHVVGRRGADLRPLQAFFAGGELARRPAFAVMRHPRNAGTFPVQAAQDRRNGFQNFGIVDRPGIAGGGQRLAGMVPDKGLRLGDGFDMGVVTFLRRVAEGEQAMIDQYQSLDPRIFFVRLRRRFGQIEPRHDVRHHAQLVSVNFPADFFRVGLVGDHQNGVGVRMVDEFVRQKRVQERFDRRIGRRRVQQVRALVVDHRLVGQGGEGPQFPQVIQLDARQAGRLQRVQVPAAALDVQNLDLLAQPVLSARFDRGVAAAVQDQGGIGPDQS